MTIAAGNDILAGDFITASAGAGDSGKGVKLNASGKLDNSFRPDNWNYLTLTAGEAVDGSTTPKAVMIATASTSTLTGGGTGTNYAFTNTSYQYAQKITTPSVVETINSVSKYFYAPDGSGSINFTCKIYADSGGQPTGAALASATDSHNFNVTTADTLVFTFSTPLAVDAGTDYHIVWSVDSVGLGLTMKGDALASQGANISTDGGTTWSASNGPFEHSTGITITVEGNFYLTNASSNNQFANNFIGFVMDNVAAGISAKVYISNDISGFTALTIASTYYLSNTAGAITTSAGTVSKKIGRAISATQLLLKNDNE